MIRTSLRFLRAAVLIAPIAITAQDWFVDIGSVTGVSMQPALNPRGDDKRDIILLDKFSIKAKYEYARGDVVMMMTPDDKPQHMVKRIIGLEGDVVSTRPNCRHRHVAVPRGHCWVESDNWMEGTDSNQYGPIPLALVEARVSAVVWPPERMRWVKRVDTFDRVLAR